MEPVSPKLSARASFVTVPQVAADAKVAEWIE